MHLLQFLPSMLSIKMSCTDIWIQQVDGWNCLPTAGQRYRNTTSFLAHLSSAQDELLWSLFVRRPSVCPSVNIFKQLLLWSRWANFAQISYGASLGWGEGKIAKMVAVCWPRWPPCPYMVKIFKNLLLQNRECLGAEPLQESSGTRGLPKFLKELPYVDVWPFYSKVKFASLCICMGKTFKNLLLRNRACLMAESLHISLATGGLPKLLK